MGFHRADGTFGYIRPTGKSGPDSLLRFSEYDALTVWGRSNCEEQVKTTASDKSAKVR
jgi:hypothetical protein